MAKGKQAEALPILEAVLTTDQIHCQAMHDLALCHLACASPERAVEMLERLMQRDYRWSYYRAWRTMIDAQTACAKPISVMPTAPSAAARCLPWQRATSRTRRSSQKARRCCGR